MEKNTDPLLIERELNIDSMEDLPQYLPLREAVYQTLKKSILKGSLKPGQLLSENGIASKLSVSRTPVREALRILEMENLVTIKPGRRVIVSIPTIQDIEETYQIRLIVETEALLKITPKDDLLIKQLENCLKKSETHLQPKDSRVLENTNTEFHSTIVSTLNNRRLEEFIASLQDTIVRYGNYSLTDNNWQKESENEHWEIVDCLKKGNNEAAVQVLRKHLMTAKEVLLSIISRNTEI